MTVVSEGMPPPPTCQMSLSSCYWSHRNIVYNNWLYIKLIKNQFRSKKCREKLNIFVHTTGSCQIYHCRLHTCRPTYETIRPTKQYAFSNEMYNVSNLFLSRVSNLQINKHTITQLENKIIGDEISPAATPNRKSYTSNPLKNNLDVDLWSGHANTAENFLQST